MSQPIEIWITGTIGQGEATLAVIAAALKSAGSDPITVHVNSEGGHATEGLAIYEALRAHPGHVRVMIEGVAASAASLIAMSGDTREIRGSGYVMIHDPMITGASGAAKDMRRNAELLESLSGRYAEIYAQRSGQPVDEIRRLMDAETWMDAADALELGFVTDVSRDRKPDEAAAIFACVNLDRLSCAPSRLRAAVAKAQTQAPKGSTMTSRHSYTTANRKPQPSPKIPRLTKREEKLAIEDLRRRIRTLDREINGPSKAAASARGSALPPAEKLELDRKMGLLDGRRECFTTHGGTKLHLGGIRAESSRSGEDLAEESAREFERQRSRKGKPETFGLPLPPETPEEAERRRRFVPPPDGGEASARAHDREELARQMGLLDGGTPHVHATETKLTFRR